ncbi:anthranilate synthase component I, partial [Candidatus Aerophobetes bacterium]|nr:anthranilate synthase component I [Candidatus Aerophobetes bacterium]
RYSFLGIDPFMVFQSTGKEAFFASSTKGWENFEVKKDPLDTLKTLMSGFRVAEIPHLPIFFGGAVGYIGYDVVKFWEKVPSLSRKDLEFPDCFFMFTRCVLVFDHLDHRIKIISFAFLDEGSVRRVYKDAVDRIEGIISILKRKPSSEAFFPVEGKKCFDVKSNFKADDFINSVKTAKNYIKEGDIFQVVLSQRFEKKTVAPPFAIYRVLRSLNPSPYMYFLRCADFYIVGSSPEVLVRKEGDEVILRPIAGTRPRGREEKEDEFLARELLNNPKEKAEHLMLVDLGRNDLGRVCKYGTVKVRELFSVEKYSHVMHLVSEIRGKLKEGKDGFDLLRACFPAGTVSGAPKVRAMQIIEELEPTARGPYAGALGYFSFSGNMDTCIVIRTIILKENTAYIQAGAGIVADSNPEAELRETQNKAKALISAINLCEEGSGWLW